MKIETNNGQKTVKQYDPDTGRLVAPKGKVKRLQSRLVRRTTKLQLWQELATYQHDHK